MSHELGPNQEFGPDLLSAEEIAKRIGMVRAVPPEPPRPPEPPPSPASAAELYRARLIAVQRALSPRAGKRAEPPPDHAASLPAIAASEPRARLLRDSAATLVGLSAVALILIAVWPPSPSGGVLGATASPPSPSVAVTAPSTPEPSPTPEATPALEP